MVSSLRSRSSTSSPSRTTTSEGQNWKRSAVISMTRGAASCVALAARDGSPTIRSSGSTTSMRIVTSIASPSEPPSEPDVQQVAVGEDAALVPHVDVVGFHGDVGIRVVRGPHHEGVAVEFLQRQETGGHAELRVEVLVAE